MEIGYAMANAWLLGKKRHLTLGRSDFGDPATVGLELRRIGKWEDAGWEDRAWGRFLGRIDGRWVVGTMMTKEFTPSAVEEYDSLEALKEVWELD